ncbi:MAG: response regulator transcription factor [Flavobacteriales bacterium]|nr:response regulator transcription factor [Flavobacteriales bacterium]
MEKIKIAIADDHQIVVEGLAAMLDRNDEIEISGTANEMRETISVLTDHRSDVLLTDLNMPGKNGIPMLNELRGQFPFLKILVLTMYYDTKLMKELEQCDIDGYLLKNSTKEDLLEAIRTVMTGGKYKHKSLEALSTNYDFAVSMGDDIKDSFLRQYSLGKRELEILLLVALGKSSQEIADNLHISIETVGTHRKNIKYKIGLKNSAEIAAFAVRNQLI